MPELLLFIAVLATFAVGFHAVHKFSLFIESNYRTESSHPSFSESGLNIGFSNPLIADSLTGTLAAFFKTRQNVTVSFFSGTEEELLEDFLSCKLNVVFLPENIAVPEKKHYNIEKVSFECAPTAAKYNGINLTAKPMTEKRILQKVLWMNGEEASVVSGFISCLKNGADWRHNDGKGSTGTGSESVFTRNS